MSAWGVPAWIYELDRPPVATQSRSALCTYGRNCTGKPRYETGVFEPTRNRYRCRWACENCAKRFRAKHKLEAS